MQPTFIPKINMSVVDFQDVNMRRCQATDHPEREDYPMSDRTCEQAGTTHAHGSKPYVMPVAGVKMPNGEPAYVVCHGMDYLNGDGQVVSPREHAFGRLTIGDALRAIDLHCGTTHHG